MAKRVLCLGLLVLFLACTNAFAGGSGNSIAPIKGDGSDMDLGIAFEYNLVHGRMNDLNDSLVGPENFEIKDVSQIYGKAIWGRGDNYNIYGNVGACNYDLKFDDNAVAVDIDMKNGIYVGGGANILYPLMEIDEKSSLSWGADIQLSCFINEVDGVSRDDNSTIIDSDGLFYGLDGQTSAYITYEYDLDKLQTSLVPYLGVYHSWVVVGSIQQLEYTKSTGQDYSESIEGVFDFLSFGLLLGLDVDVTEYITLNVEGRLIGETAITTGASFKF